MQSLYLQIAPPTQLVSSLKCRNITLPYSSGIKSLPYVPVCRRWHYQNKVASKEYVEVDDFVEFEVEEEYTLAAGLRREAMPKHIAVISDGNRRWARQKGWPVKVGHMTLELVYKQLSRLCCKFGVHVLTAFLFSSENWKRPQEEVETLMKLFEEAIRSNLHESMRRGIRISVIGERTRLPKSLLQVITEAEEKTKANTRFHLILAISYGGKSDILQACKGLCKKVKDGLISQEEINEKIFEQELGTNCTNFSSPDLMIRTGGDLRLSNFLIYQAAYAELYFTKTLLPDFGEDEFVLALKSFQQRNRRYGGGT